jgi:predicted permease
MRLLNWVGRRRAKLEGDLDRELRYHLDRRAADLVRSGLPEEEARRRAAADLGGMAQVQEGVRDEWLARWVREFFYDLRFAARSFLRSPGFTATAVVSLALGIGATTAIYSLVDQVLLRLLPVREPERLVLIDWKGQQLADGWGSGSLMSYPICRDLEQQNRFFDGVLCRYPTAVSLATVAEAKPAVAEIVSGTYFSVLGVGPALGRVLVPEDDGVPGAHPVIVLSYDYWINQLGGAADVVGRRVLVNSHPMTVVGVASAGFRGVDIGQVPALWIPASMKAQATPGWDRLLDRRARWMHIFARLKPGMTAETAQAGLQPWFRSMLEEDTHREGFPKTTAEQRAQFLRSTIAVMPAPQGRSDLRSDLAEPLWVLFAATAMLLLLACTNVAGLFLARGSAREREITTRIALGASRGRIVRQLLADSLFIAMAGGVLGVALSPMAASGLLSFVPSNIAAVDLKAAIDGRLLLFAFAISSLAGVVCGLAPALRSGRLSLIGSLRERGGSAFGGVRLRKVLVTAQIAFTLVLVVSASLFARTLAVLLVKGPGFSTTHLVSIGLNPYRSGYALADASRLIRRVYAEVAALPEVRSAAVASSQLLTGGSWGGPMTVQARERFVTDMVQRNAVTPGFFATLGIHVLAGRDFNEHDVRPPGEVGFRSAIVNQSFARRYFGGRSPIGSRLGSGSTPDTRTDAEIVGVVTDFAYRGLREESEQVFFPMFEGRDASGNFYLRVRGDAESVFAAVRSIVRNADPNLPIDYLVTLDEQVNRSLTTERLLATVSSGFGLLALLLSLVGLYGVMSFVVKQRTREIGLRLALGATRSAALRLVLGDAFVMIAAGTAIALPCVWALGHVVESQLFGVRPSDPATIAAAILLLDAVTLGAALIPAYRASTVNPTDALRCE